MYDNDSILQSKLELLMKTSMVDFTCYTYKLLHEVEEVPDGNVFYFFNRPL